MVVSVDWVDQGDGALTGALAFSLCGFFESKSWFGVYGELSSRQEHFLLWKENKKGNIRKAKLQDAAGNYIRKNMVPDRTLFSFSLRRFFESKSWLEAKRKVCADSLILSYGS